MFNVSDRLKATCRIVVYALKKSWRWADKARAARRKGSKGASVIGLKLKLARQAAGLSYNALAAKAEGLSKARLEAFERGDAMPDDTEIVALAGCLGVSEAFLRDRHDITLENVQYRSTRNAKSNTGLQLKTLDYLSRYLAVERVFGVLQAGSPAIFKVNDLAGAEDAAAKTRTAWDLGERPVADLSALLESRGVKVLQIDEGDVDGLIASVRSDSADAGHVIVVKRTEKSDRMRFTLAHEIGHMVMSPGPGIDAEAAMNRFAGAFLMPRGPFLAEIGLGRTSPPDLGRLAKLGVRFGISMQALVVRCHELGVVDDAQKTQLMKALQTRQTGSLRFTETDQSLERLCRQALAKGLIEVERAKLLLDSPALDVDTFLEQRAEEVFAPYPFAVVRLATHVASDKATPTLIFATVEMLTNEREEPFSSLPQVHKVSASYGGGEVRFDRVAMSGREAVAWYAEAGRGHVTMPLSFDRAERQAGAHGPVIQAARLSHEPVWPELSLPLERDSLLDPDWSDEPAPFVGVGARPARLNRLVAEHNETLAALAEDREAMAFLDPRLHVDLRQYPEYRGGVALLAPDPIVRSVQLFVRPRTDADGGGENVVVRLVPRQGADLDGLRLTLFEVRAGTLGEFETVEVPRDGLITSLRRQEAAAVGYILAHRDLGVLRHQTPVSFLRLDSKGRGGIKNDVDPLRVLQQGDSTRRRVVEASRAGQHWLNDVDEARIHMRELLRRARNRVWIADPQMTGGAVFDYLMTLQRRGLEIRLITSSAALDGRNDAEGSSGAADAKRALFAEQMEEMSVKGYADVEAFEVPDGAKTFNGCFLIIDDDAWLCNVSIEQLGKTSALVLKVPDPTAVISRLGSLQRIGRPLSAQDALESNQADELS